MTDEILYRKWSTVLRSEFGGRVQKICLDLGAGCPNRDGLENGGCIFCDSRGGGTGACLAAIPLEEQIHRNARSVRKRYKTSRTILYFQSYSATNLPLPVLKERIETSLSLARQEVEVVGIAVGTRPDLVPDEVLDYLVSLSERGLQIWLELGVQTISEEGLRWLNRGHGLAATEDALRRAAPLPLKLCTHLIAGIAGEAPDQLTRSAIWLAKRGVDALKFHPLHVLRNTPLEKLYLEGKYIPLTREEYASRVADAIVNIPSTMIIQRLSADARPPYLVAPAWIEDKNGVIAEIERQLRQKRG